MPRFFHPLQRGNGSSSLFPATGAPAAEHGHIAEEPCDNQAGIWCKWPPAGTRAAQLTPKKPPTWLRWRQSSQPWLPAATRPQQRDTHHSDISLHTHPSCSPQSTNIEPCRQRARLRPRADLCSQALVRVTTNTGDQQPSQLRWAALSLAASPPGTQQQDAKPLLESPHSWLLAAEPCKTLRWSCTSPELALCAAACAHLHAKHRPTDNVSSRQLRTGSVSAPCKLHVTEKEPWRHSVPPWHCCPGLGAAPRDTPPALWPRSSGSAGGGREPGLIFNGL